MKHRVCCGLAGVASLLIIGSSATLANPDHALATHQQVRLDLLLSAEHEGLEPGDYAADALARLAGQPADPTYPEFEQRLSRAYKHYLYDLSRGRLDPVLDAGWHIPHHSSPAAGSTPATADEHDNPALHAPPYQQYRHLREALQQLIRIRDSGGWPRIPVGPDLQPGTRNPQVIPLRNRLRISGHYTAEMQADPWFFDAGLVQAVRRAQTEHGLWADAIVGVDTRTVLNVPVERRIEQLKIAMERWRWMPRHPEAKYILVNIAAARLEVIEHDQPVLAMQSIVGRSYRQTPSLRGTIDTITLNPAWTVPHRIAVEDLLPQQKRDSTFLARNGFRVIDPLDGRRLQLQDIDWQRMDSRNFRYILRQDPGPGNSLGRIRFAFDNAYNIYLHGTPNSGLFRLPKRTFSSGCIRLEDPDSLAAYLLESEQGLDPNRIDAAIETGKSRHIQLQDGLPVYLVYMNVWADAEGNVYYGSDPYQRDRPLLAAWHR